MFDERAYIAQLEAANTEELTYLLTAPTLEQERTLRAYLGDAQYQRLHSLALRQRLRRRAAVSGDDARLGNVVVLHGALGSELSSVDRAGAHEQIWLNPLRIIGGQLARLRLAADGRNDYDAAYDVRASGMMKRYYGELLLSLAQHWQVRAFWYDWRKDLTIAAAQLDAAINGWFGEAAPVHLVAHSMGGMVARTFIARYRKRWDAGGGQARLVMLGTPNHGTFLVPQLLSGCADLIIKLALCDLRHDVADLRSIINSFAGLYQLLPSPLQLPAMEPLYRAETYDAAGTVMQQHLDAALRQHNALAEVVDPERMIVVAGYNQPTYVDMQVDQLSSDSSRAIYRIGMDGDGTVPHSLALLMSPDGQAVPTYYVEAAHANLPAHGPLLAALDELLATGTTTMLDRQIAAERRGAVPGTEAAALEQARLHQLLDSAATAEQQQLVSLLRRLCTRGGEPIDHSYITADEREVTEQLTRHFLSHPDRERSVRSFAVPFEPAQIAINVVYGDITALDDATIPWHTIDAIGVSYFAGAKPGQAARELDEAITRSLQAAAPDSNNNGELAATDMVLTQYARRGIISGSLTQPCFVNDPRSGNGSGGTRLIAVAGTGEPGRCGQPELTVAVSELCWSLGWQGRRHLATVLMGAGVNNLSVRDAVAAWIRGIKRALTSALGKEERCLRTITFIERDPARVIAIDEAIQYEQSVLHAQNRLAITYAALSAEEIEVLRQCERPARLLQNNAAEELEDMSSTQILVERDKDMYRFGALTDKAAIPERSFKLDPLLVECANDELACECHAERQLERGQFLEKLLIPADLRSQLYCHAPLVMILDASTARIHWELVAQSGLTPHEQCQWLDTGSAGDHAAILDPRLHYLGTSRGLTRQLRSAFAPVPEPPLARARILRVLIVADPAEDAHLPGAEEEGVAIAELFERFNTLYAHSQNRVDVRCLFGPHEATRTAVLRELTLRSYDVLHFAGHCMFDRAHPADSGWIFSGGTRLRAHELQRIDRSPKFVFSNACESGITPDRSGERAVELAPSFAEMFFARGVANFVCTAWPVGDSVARDFALLLYGGLLGIVYDTSGAAARDEPLPMYKAMCKARWAIAGEANDTRAWGAYQHYGNPFHRFFDASTMAVD